MDLWDEEEDAEDARPTIVAERPTAEQPQAVARPAPHAARTSLVQRLIEQGALEDEAPRPSTEVLRDSEVDSLTMVEEREPFSAAFAARQSEIAQVESEPPTEDAVPTVSVKRVLPSAPTPLPAPAPRAAAAAAARPPAPKLTTPPPAPSEREVTERISIPSAGMAGSIAPTARTARPSRGAPKGGLPLWQSAVAAMVLLGGGFTIMKMRDARRDKISATSIAAPQRAEPAVAPQRATPAAEPVKAEAASATVLANAEAAPARVLANAPVAEAPAPVAPPAVEPPAQPVPSAVPKPILPPKREAEDPSSATKRPRGTRTERRAIASAEPVSPAVAAASEPASAPAPEAVSEKPKAVAPAAPDLPAQPTREQVTAALNAVVPELRKCVGDRHDTAEVTLTVRPAGVVSYAVVSGPYAGSAEGSCIARAVKAAKFPAFSDPSLRVSYPFQL